MRSFRLEALACLLCLVGCGSHPSPEPATPSPESSSSSTQPQAQAQVVNATILKDACQRLGPADDKLAESAMYALVEACHSVPGGVAEFRATLWPGGRIEISAAPGGPEVVPICVVKHSLQHSVPLNAPCDLEVKIEQSSMPLPRAPDAGPD